MSTINTEALLDAVSELIQERENVLAGVVSELTARVDRLSAENSELRVRLDVTTADVSRLTQDGYAVAEHLEALRAAPPEPLEVKTDDGHLDDWKDLVLGTVDATVQQLKGEWVELRESLAEHVRKERDALSSQILDTDAGRVAEVRELEERLDTLEERIDEAASEDRVREVKASVEGEWAELRESLAEQVRKERDALSSQILDTDAGRAAEARELEERLDALEERIDGAASEDQVRGLEKSIKAVRAEWPALQAAVNAAVADESVVLVARVREENRDVQAKLATIHEHLGTKAGIKQVQDLEEVVKSISRDEQTLRLALEGNVAERDELAKTVTEVTNKVDTIHSHFDATLKTVDDLRVRVGDAVDAIDQAPAEVLSLLLERQGEAGDWKRGGTGYRALATVRHGGALWQARIDTKTEPGTGESWVMLADGASGVSVTCDDEGNVVFTTKLASGAETSASYKMPHVNPTGVFEDGRIYRRYDTVVQDGNVFWALVDDPGKIGETKGNWLCLGYRGKAGKRGPTTEEVASAVRPQLARELSAELPGLVAVAVEAMNDE